jgi:hypothetical protein
MLTPACIFLHSFIHTLILKHTLSYTHSCIHSHSYTHCFIHTLFNTLRYRYFPLQSVAMPLSAAAHTLAAFHAELAAISRTEESSTAFLVGDQGVEFFTKARSILPHTNAFRMHRAFPLVLHIKIVRMPHRFWLRVSRFPCSRTPTGASWWRASDPSTATSGAGLGAFLHHKSVCVHASVCMCVCECMCMCVCVCAFVCDAFRCYCW